MFFPSRALPFPYATVGPRSHQRWGRLRADGQRPALSASMACFICPGLFLAARWARFGAWAAKNPFVCFHFYSESKTSYFVSSIQIS